jgi:predicted glutamine amidotransferase
MCLLSVSVKSKITNKLWLENAFSNNSDGAGFAWSDNGNLICEKGFFDFESFYSSYQQIPENKTILLHFRATSRGAKTEQNCHPFNVNNGLAFAHNGTLGGFGDTTHSDTFMFNERILQPLIGRFVSLKPEFLFLLSGAIGNNNKLAFLNNREEFFIANEQEGHWVINKSIWFSNHSYQYSTGSNFTAGWNQYFDVPSFEKWLNDFKTGTDFEPIMSKSNSADKRFLPF